MSSLSSFQSSLDDEAEALASRIVQGTLPIGGAADPSDGVRNVRCCAADTTNYVGSQSLGVSMLPSLVAEDLRASLTSFLGTTFALGDDDVRAELERFVGDPQHGVFRGPFVRLRLPFRPADEGWRAALDWSPRGFRPHRHQADAWMRLASRDRIPEPTLVTTGTGSAKTESFIVPLLDHCRRQRRAGQHEIKALVLPTKRRSRGVLIRLTCPGRRNTAPRTEHAVCSD